MDITTVVPVRLKLTTPQLWQYYIHDTTETSQIRLESSYDAIRCVNGRDDGDVIG